MKKGVLRYSVVDLLLLIVAISVLTATLVAPPGRVSGVALSLMIILVPGLLAVFTITCEGYVRAFCMSSLSPTLAAALAYVLSLSTALYWNPSLGPNNMPPTDFGAFLDSLAESAAGFRTLLAILWTFSPLVGAFGVGCRWLLGIGARVTCTASK